jgi:hypothetical protein
MTANDFRKPYLDAIDRTCQKLGCNIANVLLDRRWQPMPRYRAGFAAALHETGMSSVRIGRIMSKNHSTIIQALHQLRDYGHTLESRRAYDMLSAELADMGCPVQHVPQFDAAAFQEHLGEFRELSREVNALRRRVAELEAKP